MTKLSKILHHVTQFKEEIIFKKWYLKTKNVQVTPKMLFFCMNNMNVYLFKLQWRKKEYILPDEAVTIFLFN